MCKIEKVKINSTYDVIEVRSPALKGIAEVLGRVKGGREGETIVLEACLLMKIFNPNCWP